MEFLGYEIKGRMIAASCPATETLENILECERNGAAAAILKSSSSVRLSDSGKRRCFLDNKNGLFWCESGFDREILPIAEAAALTRQAVKNRKHILIIPSITEISLNPDKWLADCGAFEQAGTDAVQLDFFYFPNLMAENNFNERFISLLKTLSEKCRIPVMPKLSINIPAEYAVYAFKKAGIKYVSLLDSIKAPPPAGADLSGNSLSAFGSFMFQLTRQYTYIMAKTGLQVCAGGGVKNAADASELLRLGATTVQLATEVLLNGFQRFREIGNAIEQPLNKSGYTGSRRIHFDSSRCINCGKCQTQTFCTTVKQITSGKISAESSLCEGCGLCEQLCPTDAVLVQSYSI